MNTIIGQPIHLLTVVDSTNNYAMEKIQCGEAEHGEVYMALEQTAGKGQRGRKWMADPGTNIIMSLVLNTCSLKMEQQFLLSAAMALGCCDFFRKKSQATEITIKWPNDLYWHDRKAGGILIENRIQASASGSIWAWSVVGIGINVNQIHFPEEIADRATSLRQITGHSENVAELIPFLCKELHKRWYQLIATDGSDMLMDYNNCLYKKGQKVTLRKGEHSWETTVQEVDHSGHLITHDRTIHRLAVGEVEWLRPTK